VALTLTQTRMDVPLSGPSLNDDDIAAVLEVLKTPVLSIGPRVRAFEQAVANYVGAAHGVAVNSGTSGLHLWVAAPVTPSLATPRQSAASVEH
jgi:dTDP-4-amino-4,6-dideoxygalactose transaminase